MPRSAPSIREGKSVDTNHIDQSGHVDTGLLTHINRTRCRNAEISFRKMVSEAWQSKTKVSVSISHRNVMSLS